MPDKPACIMAETGERLTYAEMEEEANRAAHAMRSLGLARGDTIALLFENELALFPLVWATQRCGLYLTSISNKLGASDIAYILRDSDARVLIASANCADLATAAIAEAPDVSAFVHGSSAGPLKDWSSLQAQYPPTPIGDESAGTDMLYSSGTTGRPKGVRPILPDGALDEEIPVERMGKALYGMDDKMVYLSTSPLYHAAPLRWALVAHRMGGTAIIMERFDAERALALIEEYFVTHTTVVPTHFIRMLKLPDDVKRSHDYTSLKSVVHAAAPCPVHVKQAMIDWWGPIIDEYYSGTEQCGITALSSEEWLAKPGSVGRAILGTIKILDEKGNELPRGEIGDVYFADGPSFEYYKDPVKTASAINDRGWATLGDIGRVDEDGYLFLTDRRSFMIISGGVNIYPQEIEDCLVGHPAVADVAVIGLPDEDLGEKVVAVLELAPGHSASPELASDLRAFARNRLGGPRTPREFHFSIPLPREPTGKLMKRRLRDEMLARQASIPVL